MNKTKLLVDDGADKFYRIIKTKRKGHIVYMLQKRLLFWWYTTCAYHGGAIGWYAYEYSTSDNPYYHVEYTIPEIDNEHRYPQVRLFDRLFFYLQKCPRIRRNNILGIYKPSELSYAINEHRKSGYVPSNPYPFICTSRDDCTIDDEND